MTAAPGGLLESRQELSRLRVVDALCRNGTASRRDLARLTGLSRTTVSSVVAGLEALGIVIERDELPASVPRPGRGRPAAALSLAPSAGSVVGLDLGVGRMRAVVADLSSTVLAEGLAERDLAEGSAEALDAAAELVNRLLEESGVDRSRVIGVGVGLPGPIDRRTGAVGASTILPGWAGLNPGDELAARLELRVEVDDGANLDARAEHLAGAGRGLANFVYVQLGERIGGGLVLDGRIHYGSTGLAGGLGHVQARPDGILCRCGSRGCLETVAFGRALLAASSSIYGPDLALADLLELVAQGDGAATRLVRSAGEAVGRVAADLCNALNPEAIIVGGELGAACSPLLDGIRESIDRYALPDVAADIDVRRALLGGLATVQGALALVIDNTEQVLAAGQRLATRPRSDA